MNVLRNDILGTIAFVLKKYKDAIFHYRKSLELNPFVFWIHNNLAAAYYEDEQYGLAIDEWERGFDQYPDDGIPLIISRLHMQNSIWCHRQYELMSGL